MEKSCKTCAFDGNQGITPSRCNGCDNVDNPTNWVPSDKIISKMKSSINKDSLLRVIRHCHYCGDSQTSPTVFSGLFRMPEEVIAENDSAFFEDDYFEITVCQDCFKNFNNDYNEIVKLTFESWR